jgi:hypothetical protein
MKVLVLLMALAAATMACSRTTTRPTGREASPGRDAECSDPTRPKAYFYPAEERTRYAPDDPFKDGCVLLVPDHLFCCPSR